MGVSQLKNVLIENWDSGKIQHYEPGGVMWLQTVNHCSTAGSKQKDEHSTEVHVHSDHYFYQLAA